MDLRKAILLKKPLQDSFNSLNNSGASIYESAAEDSDSSLLYYSFTNNSFKSFDASIEEENPSNELENSHSSEADNKENTVIMKESDELGEQPEGINIEPEKMEVDDIKLEQAAPKMEQEVKHSDDIQLPKVSDIIIEKTEFVIPQIIIEDPNENLINPFTLRDETILESTQDLFTKLDNRESIEVDKVTKRKVMEANKKSASKIPTKTTHFYSPVMRKSIDRKSKAITKPLVRRTIYETRSMSKPKVLPVIPPVETKTSVPKVVINKCTFSGCLRQFHTVKSLQEHLKTHKSNIPIASTSSASSFKCKWCDKTFELNNALTNHMLEKCTKISFGEKRKLLAQQDKLKPLENKRKSMFIAPPPPKKRSPKRQTLNKSGIIITPKKTLKCECGKLFTNVLEFANHTIAHKYEGALQTKQE